MMKMVVYLIYDEVDIGLDLYSLLIFTLFSSPLYTDKVQINLITEKCD